MDRQQNRHLQVPEMQPHVPEMSANQEPPESTQRFNIEYADVRDSPLIGYGRYGRVYRHEYKGTTVAVKDISFTAKEQPHFERIMCEETIFMKLRHRSIITLFDFKFVQQHLLLVMEFAAGGNLGDVLKDQKRLEPSVVTNWAGQICDGMSYLHEQYVIHGNLRCSNVLVLEPIDNSDLLRKTMKIANFGFAYDGYYETGTTLVTCGTRAWMAPEVFEPHRRFSKASDVYSFGMVVWNLLTGNEPSKDLAKSFQVERKLPQISPYYVVLLKKCFALDDWERPTFTDIQADITQWKRRNETESEGISSCIEELGSLLVNFHGEAAGVNGSLSSPRDINHRDITYLEQIGKGSFGVVFRGKWQEKIVALKLLLEEFQEKERTAFEMEGRRLYLLQHPNIISLVGICKSPDVILVMEYAEGRSLLDVLTKHGAMQHDVCVNWASQIASGLAHLHGMNCVHRDLTWNNVLIMQCIEPHADLRKITLKISDLGLLGINYESTRTPTKRSYAIEFMAPEAMRSKNPLFSKKSDVWSFGVVLFTIIDGDIPEWPVSVARIPETWSVKFKAILNGCWQSHHEHRMEIKEICDILTGVSRSV